MFKCPNSRWYRIFLLPAAALFAVLLFAAPAATAAPKFEVPGVQNASDILPPELISGPHHRVREKVICSGYMHVFEVDSDYGAFQVTGDFALRKLVREIGAIAALLEVKKGEAYLDGLKSAAVQPIEFGANLVTDPVDTISGVPKGIASLFHNVKTGLTTQASKSEDTKMEQLLQVSTNKRQLAQQLGIDVYSTNKVLQKELNSVAWATSLGSLTVSAALAPVGGAAIAAVSLTRTAQQLNELVNQYPPQRLRQMNQEKLEAMGMPLDLATRFLDRQDYTLTQVTDTVGSLEALSGARGRDAFLREALSADNEESANYFMYIAETMRGYNAKVSPIREISVYGPLVFARASDDTVLIPLPLDYAMWTEGASQRVPAAIASYKAMNPGLKKFEFWYTGTASKMAREEGTRHGIKTVEKVGSRIEFTY